MNIVYENIKVVLPETERRKYKGNTVMNITNEIFAQLRKK